MMSWHDWVCGWSGGVVNVGCGESVEWPFLLKTTVFLGGFSNKLNGARRVGWAEWSSFKKGPKKRGFFAVGAGSRK